MHMMKFEQQAHDRPVLEQTHLWALVQSVMEILIKELVTMMSNNLMVRDIKKGPLSSTTMYSEWKID